MSESCIGIGHKGKCYPSTRNGNSPPRNLYAARNRYDFPVRYRPNVCLSSPEYHVTRASCCVVTGGIAGCRTAVPPISWQLLVSVNYQGGVSVHSASSSNEFSWGCIFADCVPIISVAWVVLEIRWAAWMRRCHLISNTSYIVCWGMLFVSGKMRRNATAKLFRQSNLDFFYHDGASALLIR